MATSCDITFSNPVDKGQERCTLKQSAPVSCRQPGLFITQAEAEQYYVNNDQQLQFKVNTKVKKMIKQNKRYIKENYCLLKLLLLLRCFVFLK